MKSILSYIKNASIRTQLISVFFAIGIAVGGITMISISLSNSTMKKHERYLDYVAMISSLSEIDDSSKRIINELAYNSQGTERIQIAEEIQKAEEVIDKIRLQTTSVDISLRLRVVEYLFQQYENKAGELINLMQEENISVVKRQGESSEYEIYLEAVELLSRIDTYIQEMISCSVKENNELLKETLRSSKRLQYALIIIAGLVLAVAMYLSIRYSRYLEGLIGGILNVTKSISAGNRSKRLEIEEGPEEIREITEGFNELIMTMEQLNRQADEKVKLELKLKEAQLQGLQFQIQPHFLFNTLNAISMLAIIDNNRKVYDLIMALSRFMRYSLKKTAALVPVEEEIDMVSQYLYILKARMGTKLDYEVSNKLEEKIEIPPFILQPIVENAFKHGIEEKVGNGRIIVRINRRRDRAVLRVYNDGAAMSKEELNAIRLQCQNKEVHMDQEKHIGIKNIVYRLNMLFPAKVNYKVYSSSARGTLFAIEILL